MSDRQRHSPSLEDFEDPLSNYEAEAYGDELERALCETSVVEVKSSPAVTIRANASVQSALEQLGTLQIACLPVMDGDKLVGIFTERDVLNRVAPNLDAVREQPVSDVMTPQPTVIYETDHVADALSAIAVGGYRHVPVLDVNEKIVGIVGPQRINEFLFEHFQST